MYVIKYKANKGIIGWIHVVFHSNHSGLFRWSLHKEFYRIYNYGFGQN